jgi:hypothetical protein
LGLRFRFYRCGNVFYGRLNRRLGNGQVGNQNVGWNLRLFGFWLWQGGGWFGRETRQR